MGGLVGRFGAAGVSVRRLVRVLDARGPSGRWEHEEPAFAFAVVASGEAEHAPIGEADGVVAAVDGHVPGLRALAAELELAPEVGLGAVVAAHIARTGFVRTLRRLPGDVALAAWDRASGTGWLARDRAGARGMVHVEAAPGLVFSTEARALVVSGVCAPAPSVALGSLVHAGALLPPAAAASGAAALEPGGHLAWSGRAVVQGGSVPGSHPPRGGGNVDRWARSARFGLDLAYQARARAAGPHALALGGLGSAALLACRPREFGPALALSLRVAGALEAGVVHRAAAAKIELVSVELTPDVVLRLMEELTPHPAWARPESWAWAALGEAAWRAGMSGLTGGVGARHGFDPPRPGLRSRVQRRLDSPVSRLCAEYGAPQAGDVVPHLGVSPGSTDPGGELARRYWLPEAELSALDAGAAAFGLDAFAPFADPAFLDVACQIPADVHHAGGPRSLLAGLAGAPGAASAPIAFPLRSVLAALPLDSLAERLVGRLASDHVRAVVQGARRHERASERRAFALEVLSRGLLG